MVMMRGPGASTFGSWPESRFKLNCKIAMVSRCSRQANESDRRVRSNTPLWKVPTLSRCGPRLARFEQTRHQQPGTRKKLKASLASIKFRTPCSAIVNRTPSTQTLA